MVESQEVSFSRMPARLILSTVIVDVSVRMRFACICLLVSLVCPFVCMCARVTCI